MPHTEELQVTDPVQVYCNYPYDQFYILGRIVYIDTPSETHEKDKEYGVLFYDRDNDDFKVIHVNEHKIRKLIAKHPAGCPTHSITIAYIDEIVEKERNGSPQQEPSKHCTEALQCIQKAIEIDASTGPRQAFCRSEWLRHAILALQHELKETQ